MREKNATGSTTETEPINILIPFCFHCAEIVRLDWIGFSRMK